MNSSKNVQKRINKIKQHQLRNYSYLRRIKRYKNLCLYYLNKQLVETNVDYLILILKYLSLTSSFLDKSQKFNILSKRTVARKKAKLQRAVNYFLLKNYE